MFTNLKKTQYWYKCKSYQLNKIKFISHNFFFLSSPSTCFILSRIARSKTEMGIPTVDKCLHQGQVGSWFLPWQLDKGPSSNLIITNHSNPQQTRGRLLFYNPSNRTCGFYQDFLKLQGGNVSMQDHGLCLRNSFFACLEHPQTFGSEGTFGHLCTQTQGFVQQRQQTFRSGTQSTSWQKRPSKAETVLSQRTRLLEKTSVIYIWELD